MAWYDPLVSGATDIGNAVSDGWDEVVEGLTDATVDEVQTATRQKIDDITANTRSNPTRSPHSDSPVGQYQAPVSKWMIAGVVISAAALVYAVVKG